jgi:outer membrane protein assembly factor BamB
MTHGQVNRPETSGKQEHRIAPSRIFVFPVTAVIPPMVWAYTQGLSLEGLRVRTVPMKSTVVIILVCLAFVSVPVSVISQDWPQWRGNGLGASPESRVPLDWSAEKNVLWRTALPGRGHSSPVIRGGKVFLTADIEGAEVPGASAVKHVLDGQDFKHPDAMGANLLHELYVMCLDAKSGRMLWKKLAYAGPTFDDRHRKGSFASPTIATDIDRVFAYFGSEGIFCYDFNGSLVWSNSPGKIATLGMGPSTSPVLGSKTVIVQCDQDEGENSFIAGFDKKTGILLWKTKRNVSVSWSTPMVVSAGGHEQVIASGMQQIAAYDTATGEELWKHDGLQNNSVPSVVADEKVAYLAAGYPKKKTLAIRLGARGDLTGTTNLLWQYDRGSGYVPSPLLMEGRLYLMTDAGHLSCLDATTGAVQYDAERLPEPAKFTASPLGVAGHVLMTSESGDTFVVKAGAKHEFVRKNSIGEKVFASLAVADGRLFIRGETNLYCIGANTAAK